MSGFALPDNVRTVMCSALLVYLAAVNIIAVIVCAHDKKSAKKNRPRVPEAELLMLSALGGALFMLITMLMIRHKTRKPKFMIALPLMTALHIAVALLIAF